MRFAFIAKHRSIWPVAWLCEALDVSRSGFHAWLTRSPSNRTRYDDALLGVMRASFLHGVFGAMSWPRVSIAVFTGLNA